MHGKVQTLHNDKFTDYMQGKSSIIYHTTIEVSISSKALATCKLNVSTFEKTGLREGNTASCIKKIFKFC